MIIKLTNKENLNLEWNFLCIKYLQEYPGGLNKLEQDINRGKNKFNLTLTLISAIIRSNYPSPLTNEEALALVPFDEVDNLAIFIKKEMQKNQVFKKKTTSRVIYQSKK